MQAKDLSDLHAELGRERLLPVIQASVVEIQPQNRDQAENKRPALTTFLWCRVVIKGRYNRHIVDGADLNSSAIWNGLDKAGNNGSHVADNHERTKRDW